MTPLNADILQQKLVDGLFQIEPEDSSFIVNPEWAPRLGAGQFAEVFATTNPITGSPWAVKLSKPNSSPAEDEMLKREYKILSGPLRGAPHTVHARGICEGPDLKAQFAMQRLHGVNLLDFLNKNRYFFTAEKLLNVARQALEALDFYHSKEIVHSDLKPSNCFYNPLTEKLTIFDFGLCFFPSYESFQGGTLAYAAPEVLLKRLASYETDIWALGVILFMLYTGSAMFFDGDKDQNDHIITETDLLALFQIQLGLPFRIYAGRSMLEALTGLSSHEVKERYLKFQILAQADSVIPSWRKIIDPWYLRPWYERIKYAAQMKRDEAAAHWIIPFLKRVFVSDSRHRITAQQGLEMLSLLKPLTAPCILPPPAMPVAKICSQPRSLSQLAKQSEAAANLSRDTATCAAAEEKALCSGTVLELLRNVNLGKAVE